MRMEVDEESMRHAVEQAGGRWRQAEADLVGQRPMIARQLDKNRLQSLRFGSRGNTGLPDRSFPGRGRLVRAGISSRIRPGSC